MLLSAADVTEHVTVDSLMPPTCAAQSFVLSFEEDAFSAKFSVILIIVPLLSNGCSPTMQIWIIV